MSFKISIHAPRAGGDLGKLQQTVAPGRISIHAPRAGGDLFVHFLILSESYFNPRPPCGGRRAQRRTAAQATRFQSTPPVRGATSAIPTVTPTTRDFNPRPPCGGRRIGLDQSYTDTDFNPRPPCGGRLYNGGDAEDITHFNPRPPCGGRQKTGSRRIPNIKFQSTPPVRGATGVLLRASAYGDISIHAPRAGGDTVCAAKTGAMPDFNPRPPCGGRLGGVGVYGFSCQISIHAPRAGGDKNVFHWFNTSV